MTTLELTKLLGKTVLVPVGKMAFRGRVADAQHQYGNVRVLVQPIEGHGESWMNLESVKLEGGGK